MIKSFIYIICLSFVIGSCKSNSGLENNATGAMHPDSVFASIERSPCFGKCPAFRAVIYNNGFATYEGRSTVTKMGLFKGSVTADQIKLIKDKAIEFRMDTLQGEYINKYLVDFPGHSMSVLINGQLKSITVMETELPQSIYTFEIFLENILETVSWTKVEARD